MKIIYNFGGSLDRVSGLYFVVFHVHHGKIRKTAIPVYKDKTSEIESTKDELAASNRVVAYILIQVEEETGFAVLDCSINEDYLHYISGEKVFYSTNEISYYALKDLQIKFEGVSSKNYCAKITTGSRRMTPFLQITNETSEEEMKKIIEDDFICPLKNISK